MQAVLLKTSFVVIFQCNNTLWCHINILFVDILTILMYLFQFLLSYNSKQLSTFHLPFGGDENVLAKDLAPWPKVWNPRFLSSYRLVFVFFRNFLKINILEIHYLTLLLHHLQRQRPPACINAHRPWACRGMPFDDVCQMPSATQSLSLGAGISIRSSMWRVWVGPLARSCVWGFPTSKSRSDFRDLVNYPYDLAEIWHTYPPRHGEDDFLLTFFPLNIFCWPK